MKKTAVAASSIAGLALALVPSSVSAHETASYHGLDKGWINSSHSRVGIKDRECDGNSAFVEVTYRTKQGTTWLMRFSDSNGCKPGATKWKAPNKPLQIHTCERTVIRETCTKYKDV